MSHQATQAEIEAVVDRVEEIGLKTELSRGEERTVIGVIGGNAYAYRDAFSHLGGIQEIVPITKPFKLASREFRKTDTVIDTVTTVKQKGHGFYESTVSPHGGWYYAQAVKTAGCRQGLSPLLHLTGGH